MSQASINIFHKKKKYTINNKYNKFYWVGFIFFTVTISIVVWIITLIFNYIKDVENLPISKVIITGNYYYTNNNDIKKAILSLNIRTTFITTDVYVIQNQIKKIPWIKQVYVRKQWPDVLKIHIIEYKPYAKWNDNAFINIQGDVFNLPTILNTQDNYLMFNGPEGSQYGLIDMYKIIQRQLKLYNLKIKIISMSTRHAWQIVLTNNIKLNIGKKNINKRIKCFLKIYPFLKKKNNKHIEYIDLRYSNGIAVSWVSS